MLEIIWHDPLPMFIFFHPGHDVQCCLCRLKRPCMCLRNAFPLIALTLRFSWRVRATHFCSGNQSIGHNVKCQYLTVTHTVTDGQTNDLVYMCVRLCASKMRVCTHELRVDKIISARREREWEEVGRSAHGRNGSQNKSCPLFFSKGSPSSPVSLPLN